MKYWQGIMDWATDKDWKCETCDSESHNLTWGFMQGICRCDTCHTRYSMNDDNKTVVTKPISRLKEEYKKPLRTAWQKWQTPIDELSDAQWDEIEKEVK